MEIKLPENPNLYLILIGFFFIASAFFIVAITGERDFTIFLLILLGTILFIWGWTGLKNDADLRKKLLGAQIRKIEKETQVLNKS